MRYVTIAAALGLFAFGGTGTASAQINNCNQGNAVVGTAVGAVLGGTTGGIIANNSRGFRGSRSFRGSRGFRRGGFRRGNQGVGIVLGALAGGIVGNQIATAKSRNCITQKSTYGSQNLAGGPIDHNARRLGDPYGGQRVIAQPQQHTYSQPATYNAAATQTAHTTSIVTQPVVSGNYCTRTDPHTHSSPVHHPTVTSGQFPITTQGQGQAPQPVQPVQQQGLFQPICQNINRTTNLPDGRIINEPIEYCQFSPGGEWIQR